MNLHNFSESFKSIFEANVNTVGGRLSFPVGAITANVVQITTSSIFTTIVTTVVGGVIMLIIQTFGKYLIFKYFPYVKSEGVCEKKIEPKEEEAKKEADKLKKNTV